MKIGIDIRNIGKKRTGDEVVFFNLVKNLALIDTENTFWLFTDIVDAEILDKIKKDLGIEKKNNFEIISLRTNSKFSWNFWTLPAYLRQNPIDIYLTQYITPFFVSRRIRIMTIVHDVSFRVFPQFIKLADLFFLRTLIPLSLRRADKIIAVSEFTKNEIIKYYKINPEKIEWIHNAVADDYLKTEISEESLLRVRKKYNLPHKFILYIGTLQPRKNIPILIEAYAKVKDRIPGTKLVLAGGKGHNYDAKIDEATAKNNLSAEVNFPGFIDEEDKAVLMSLADVFVFPSFYEGFGIPILEAFASKAPVIASDIPPHQEIAKGAALFFNPTDAGSLEDKLLAIFADSSLRQGLIEKGLLQVGQFSWSKTANDFRRIFESTNGDNVDNN